MLLYVIPQDYRTVRSMFEWLFPELTNFTIDMDKVRILLISISVFFILYDDLSLCFSFVNQIILIT